MANFDTAFQRTVGKEGGYSNDPTDTGQETLFGISRKFNPTWPGWAQVDAFRSLPNFQDLVEHSTVLLDAARQYYYDYYWTPVCGRIFTSQAVANELFDCGVNLGITRAITFLQRALNLLNNNQKFYSDIVEDGSMGDKTCATIKVFEALAMANGKSENATSYLLKLMMILRGYHYIEFMTQSPTQEKFAKGWLNRITLE